LSYEGSEVSRCHLQEWRATRQGQFVLIKDDDVLGFFDSLEGAFKEGTARFQLESKISPGTMHAIFVDIQVRSGNLASDRIDGLIGRDVLTHFTLSCDGRSGQVKMTYHRPAIPAAP
jgi:hypothetical protein